MSLFSDVIPTEASWKSLSVHLPRSGTALARKDGTGDPLHFCKVFRVQHSGVLLLGDLPCP